MNRLLVCFLVMGLIGLCVCPAQAQVRNGAKDKSDAPEFGPLPEVPSGHTARYLVTYMTSDTTAGYRSATVVTVTNNSSVTCGISADWMYQSGTTLLCTNNLSIAPGNSADFCSRGLHGSITTCNATCSLNFHEGKVRVASQADPAGACANIGVHARVYYTTGTTTDAGVAAVSDPTIVRIGQGNQGH